MAFCALSQCDPVHLLSVGDLARQHERLLTENEQLKRAVTSHALIDQAIGAVVVLGQVPPEDAWRILKDVSQRTNTKLRVIAENVMMFAQGGALPEPEIQELRRALDRYSLRKREPQSTAM